MHKEGKFDRRKNGCRQGRVTGDESTARWKTGKRLARMSRALQVRQCTSDPGANQHHVRTRNENGGRFGEKLRRKGDGGGGSTKCNRGTGRNARETRHLSRQGIMRAWMRLKDQKCVYDSKASVQGGNTVKEPKGFLLVAHQRNKKK